MPGAIAATRWPTSFRQPAETRKPEPILFWSMTIPKSGLAVALERRLGAVGAAPAETAPRLADGLRLRRTGALFPAEPATIAMMSQRAWRLAALLVIGVLGGVTPVPVRSEAAAFHGAVVDGETGDPLEGAVIVVVWHRFAYVPLPHPVRIVYKVTEQLTVADGEFSVDVSPGLISPAFADREVVVYKPGYRPVAQTSRDKHAPLFGERVIRLTKIRVVQEARTYRIGSDVHVYTCVPSLPPNRQCVPESQVPNLVRLLEIQKKIFDPYPAGHFEAEPKRSP